MKITKSKAMLFGVILIVAMLSVATWVDYSRAKSSKAPMFTYDTVHYKDGGSVKSSGIFYTITDLNRISRKQLENGSICGHTRVGYVYEHRFLPLSFDESYQIRGGVVPE